MNEEIIETEYENIDEILEETELKAVLEGLLFVVGEDGVKAEQISQAIEKNSFKDNLIFPRPGSEIYTLSLLNDFFL